MSEPVRVPLEYRCPLCPNHRDDLFYDSKILGSPICEGCSVEISMLLDQDERPEDPVLDRLEAITGLTFKECRKIYIEEAIQDLENRLKPEYMASFAEETSKQLVKEWKRTIEYYKAELQKL
jgi:hypothetical protein